MCTAALRGGTSALIFTIAVPLGSYFGNVSAIRLLLVTTRAAALYSLPACLATRISLEDACMMLYTHVNAMMALVTPSF